MSGRPLTTGRFETRAELLERIRFLWQDTSCNQATIARNCHVSPPVVGKIIDARSWNKSDDWRWLDYGDMCLYDEEEVKRHEPIEPKEHLSAPSLATCGHGWMPEASPLPAHVMRELDLMGV